jgi:hypothetical protein
MSQQQHGQDDFLGPTRAMFNLITWFLAAYSFPLEPWLRRPGTCGARFFGFQAMLSFFVVPLTVSSFEVRDPRFAVVIYFLGATMLWMFVHNAARWVKQYRGNYRHSYYKGDSWLPGPNKRAWGVYEPLLCMGLGLLSIGVSPAFGLWVFTAAFALAIGQGLLEAKDASVVRRRRDAMLDQQYYNDLTKDEEFR